MPTSVDGWHQCELLYTCAVKDIKDIFKRVRKVVVFSLSLSQRFKWMCFLWVEIDNEWQSECVNVCGVFWEMVTGRGLNFLSPWGQEGLTFEVYLIHTQCCRGLAGSTGQYVCALGWICLNLNVLHAMVSSRLFSKSKQSQHDYRLDLVRDFTWTSGGR